MRVLVLLALLAGCAGVNQTLPPRIDDVTGETIVTLRKPVVLARQVPHLSTKARDYVYLGPVEIDRMGAQEFFLWVGMASTVDPAYTEDKLTLIAGQSEKMGDIINHLRMFSRIDGGYPGAEVVKMPLVSVRLRKTNRRRSATQMVGVCGKPRRKPLIKSR